MDSSQRALQTNKKLFSNFRSFQNFVRENFSLKPRIVATALNIWENSDIFLFNVLARIKDANHFALQLTIYWALLLAHKIQQYLNPLF